MIKKNSPIKLPTIGNLPPNLWLLLKKISIIEEVPLSELLSLIKSHQKIEAPLDKIIAIFCAHYFAQASTLQGHYAAGHGFESISQTVKTVFEVVTLTHPGIVFQRLVENKELLSEAREPFISS